MTVLNVQVARPTGRHPMKTGQPAQLPKIFPVQLTIAVCQASAISTVFRHVREPFQQIK
jgi:hypothetical protein